MGKVTMLFKYHKCLALKKKLVRPLLRKKKIFVLKAFSQIITGIEI